MPDGAEDEKAKKAEKRKALVDNVLDINTTGPSAKKGRMDPFPQGAGNQIMTKIIRGYKFSVESERRLAIIYTIHTFRPTSVIWSCA